MSSFNPTPEIVQKHFSFINNLSKELELKYPNDTFLESLNEEENQELKVSSDWFTKYYVEYPPKKQADAMAPVMAQAEALSDEWTK